MPDFRARLAALGLSQVELRRWVEAVTGHRLAPTTTSRWAHGHRAMPPEMDALLAVIERPDLLHSLKRSAPKPEVWTQEELDWCQRRAERLAEYFARNS